MGAANADAAERRDSAPPDHDVGLLLDFSDSAPAAFRIEGAGMVMNINITRLAGNVVGTTLSIHVGADAADAGAMLRPSRRQPCTIVGVAHEWQDGAMRIVVRREDDRVNMALAVDTARVLRWAAAAAAATAAAAAAAEQMMSLLCVAIAGAVALTLPATHNCAS